MGSLLTWALAGLGAIGGILYVKDKVTRSVRDRAFRRLFSVAPTQRLIIACPSQSHLDSDPNTITTHEDLMAVTALQRELLERGIHHEVILHSDLGEGDKSENLVLLCGPVGNSITAKLLAMGAVPYHFVQDEGVWLIADAFAKKVHQAPKPGELDFGIIAKVRNPWSRPDNPTFIFVAAGIEGLGTWGAAHYFARHSDNLHRRLRAERGSSSQPFAGVVRVDKDGSYPPRVRLAEARPV